MARARAEALTDRPFRLVLCQRAVGRGCGSVLGPSTTSISRCSFGGSTDAIDLYSKIFRSCRCPCSITLTRCSWTGTQQRWRGKHERSRPPSAPMFHGFHERRGSTAGAPRPSLAHPFLITSWRANAELFMNMHNTEGTLHTLIYRPTLRPGEPRGLRLHDVVPVGTEQRRLPNRDSSLRRYSGAERPSLAVAAAVCNKSSGHATRLHQQPARCAHEQLQKKTGLAQC